MEIKKKYDYLVVGAGLFGSVFAHEAVKKGKACLVIDRRNHVGGNIYSEEVEGIQVHRYGPHIFHTNDNAIWDYVNQFAEFNRYVYSPLAEYCGELYNLPFNMNTFSRLWGIKTPKQAREIIERQTREPGIKAPGNLEEQALTMVGKDVYEKLIKGYTRKQWGRSCTDLPAAIIKRIPVRYTYDNNYFDDCYQGIPIGGYTQISQKMLKGSDVLLNAEYAEFARENPEIARKTVYTGAMDAFYNYSFGALEYRTVRFETEVLSCDNFQGNSVINYTSADVPYTRIIEHKHFEFGKQPGTVISREYPSEWGPDKEPYYPVNDERNTELYKKYKDLANQEGRMIFGGRLAQYRYLDMHQVIREALECARKELSLGGSA